MVALWLERPFGRGKENLPMAWYNTFYDEHYLKEYASGLTDERTQREVGFINSTLQGLRRFKYSVVMMAVNSHGIRIE